MKFPTTLVAGLSLLLFNSHAFAMAKPQPTPPPQPQTNAGNGLATSGLPHRPVGETGRDKFFTDTNGEHYYFTAHDGTWRHLSKVTGVKPALSPTSGAGAASFSFSSLFGGASAATTTATTSSSLPSRVMLNEIGMTTPVRDQGSAGSCTIFSAIGAIESEYMARYGLNLDLSEEYVISMMNEARSPDWVGGMPSEKLYIASYYGVPPEKDWPYILPSGQVFANVEKTFGVNPNNSSAVSTLGNNVWNNTLDRDIANYSDIVYPPAQAHVDAIYGPTPNSLAGVQLNGTDPTPIETLISQHHAISFATALGVWAQNPVTGVFEYNSSGDPTIDHAMVVVGYDHSLKVFRIRNSWGAGWNGDGYADITYDLFFRTVAGPTYVTALRNPTDTGQGGVGAWRGFWRGSVDGNPGVAVIHHAYTPTGQTGVVTNDAGYFYANNGKVSTIEWVGGNSTYAQIKIDGDSRTLYMAGDRMSAATVSESWFRKLFDNDEADWSRCVGQSTASNLNPSGYGASTSDPYLFPLVNGCKY